MDKRFAVRICADHLSFSSAHFLTFDDGSREELHGHNYRVRVLLQGEPDPSGMVIDFILLTSFVEEICRTLGHRVLLPQTNPRLRIEQDEKNIRVHFGEDVFSFPVRDVLVLPVPNVTCELLARHIAGLLKERIRCDCGNISLQQLEIELEELPGQSAIYRE